MGNFNGFTIASVSVRNRIDGDLVGFTASVSSASYPESYGSPAPAGPFAYLEDHHEDGGVVVLVAETLLELAERAIDRGSLPHDGLTLRALFAEAGLELPAETYERLLEGVLARRR